MTFTDPTPPTADDDSPAALLAQIRRDYTDTGKRIKQLTAELKRLHHELGVLEHFGDRMVELNVELNATRAAHQQWGRMLPRGDTARGNGTS